MILLIDNYDSFAHNLGRYLVQLGAAVRVVRNDAITVEEVAAAPPRAIVLSPGPCTPTEAGVSLRLVRELHASVPMLGVCLGHQTIAAAFGGRIVRAAEPVHGRASAVVHHGQDVFAGLDNPLLACRYHSLVVDPGTVPDPLEVTAETEEGIIMAIRHRNLPVFGVQFHPESVLTRQGYELLANFLRIAGLRVERHFSARDEPRLFVEPDSPWPDLPITF
ncbi:MAG: aminodeoxychorismate/anthranilate synthase component II [Planctomycetes bacterium]|nr:aminodeoxychorismate/anthranilate synthase component II [Planctomycetota bacterium]